MGAKSVSSDIREDSSRESNDRFGSQEITELQALFFVTFVSFCSIFFSQFHLTKN
jgi:hypothetical protein